MRPVTRHDIAADISYGIVLTIATAAILTGNRWMAIPLVAAAVGWWLLTEHRADRDHDTIENQRRRLDALERARRT